jgi:flavin-dependent dehydrogenase
VTTPAERDDPPDDVLIVGAGLAGGALALRLARRGLRVRLLDAARFPRPKLCGEFLSPEGAAALERLGPALARLLEASEPIRVARLTTPGGRALEARVIDADGRPGAGLSRTVMDHAIVEAAVAAGVAFGDDTRVSGPIVDAEGRVVGVSARRGRDASARAFHARLVVAADGRGSPLVKATGRTRVRSRFRPALFGLKRHLVTEHPDADAAEPPGTVSLHLVRGGYIGACRIDGGRTNLCGLLPDRLAARHRGDLDALAAAEFPRNPALGRLWAASAPDGPWKTVANVRVEHHEPTAPGILYAGDARGTVDPLGGQGMTMALLGAELIEPFVVHAMTSGAEGATPAVQAAYARAWERRFAGRIRLCRLFHHLLIRPAIIDLAARVPAIGPDLLAAAFQWTRDPEGDRVAPGVVG